MSISSYICSRLVEDVVPSQSSRNLDLEPVYERLLGLVKNFEDKDGITLENMISKLEHHSDMSLAKNQYCTLMCEISRANHDRIDIHCFVCFFIGTKYFMNFYMQHERVGIAIASSFWLQRIVEPDDVIWNYIKPRENGISHIIVYACVYWLCLTYLLRKSVTFAMKN